MTYSGTLPTLTSTYAGLVNGDTPASLATPPTLSTVPATSHAGSYAITVAGAVDPDYTISFVPGTLIITPAPLTITADDKSKVYGAPLPALTASYSGFVNGDTAASLTTASTLATTATASSHVGSYAITASGAADPDYRITYLSGTLIVTTAHLTITADNKAKVYGAPLPGLTASYSGFVNGDTPASLTTAPTLTTPATASSHAGSYAITASGAVDADYSISYVSGSLTVTPAPLTISADNKSKVYGAPLPVLTASYAGFVNGDTAASLTTPPVLGTTAKAISPVGSYTITASGASDADYAITYVAGALGVTPATLTVTANHASRIYGVGNPTFTASYTGFINGETLATSGVKGSPKPDHHRHGQQRARHLPHHRRSG
jgi:hypothetical protein